MTDTVHGAAPAGARVSDAYRWTQLAIGVGAMVMIANYQYGWTFFVTRHPEEIRMGSRLDPAGPSRCSC